MANSEIPVQPTSSDQPPVYTDSSLTALFQSHVNFFTMEHQLFWLRGSAMLIANTVLLNGVFAILFEANRPTSPARYLV
jgi:hypothetical protein